MGHCTAPRAQPRWGLRCSGAATVMHKSVRVSNLETHNNHTRIQKIGHSLIFASMSPLTTCPWPIDVDSETYKIFALLARASNY